MGSLDPELLITLGHHVSSCASPLSCLFSWSTVVLSPVWRFEKLMLHFPDCPTRDLNITEVLPVRHFFDRLESAM
jgi:hypothetical protein